MTPDMWNFIYTENIVQIDPSWEVVTEHPGFLDPAESLHDTNGFLNPLFGLQLTCARVRRREVAIPAQPILGRTQGNQRKFGGLPNMITTAQDDEPGKPQWTNNIAEIHLLHESTFRLPANADLTEAIWCTALLVTIDHTQQCQPFVSH